jgi:hypothetical protein
MFRFKTWTTAAAVGGALAGSLLIVEPAHAQSTYEGRVTANGGLLVRHLPTTASALEGKLSKGQQIEIVCKVRGSSVNGNDLWYSLPPTLNEWVAARYVQDIGPAPRWCGSSERFVGRTTTALSKRAAPTTASAKVGSVARGAGVDIICKLEAGLARLGAKRASGAGIAGHQLGGNWPGRWSAGGCILDEAQLEGRTAG